MDIPAVEALLRAKKCSVTPQRRAILRALADDHAHPTAAQLFERLTAADPVTSRATVYNTLQLLRELGVVREVYVPGDESRFDPDPTPHHHFLCTGCGALSDVPDADVQVARALPEGFEVRRAGVLFEGRCPSCHEG
jgi:Fur family peroxide stress response transcriptional regulator